MASMLAPGAIDLVLDQNTGALRDGALQLAPRTEELLKEAAQLHVPVRIVVSAPLDDAAIAALEALQPLAQVVRRLDARELPDAPAPHVLVAADRVVRREAADGGRLPVPHAALALPVVLGERLQFARVTGDVRALRGVAGRGSCPTGSSERRMGRPGRSRHSPPAGWPRCSTRAWRSNASRWTWASRIRCSCSSIPALDLAGSPRTRSSGQTGCACCWRWTRRPTTTRFPRTARTATSASSRRAPSCLRRRDSSCRRPPSRVGRACWRPSLRRR